MGFIMLIVGLINTVLNLVVFVIIASVILNLLIHFEVLNRFKHRWVYKLEDFFGRLTEPMYRVVRRYIPPLNGIDFSPLVILLAIQFLQQALVMLATS
jgi:YggT family protein